MKLNPECIRDLLLYLEENLMYNKGININNLQLANYTHDDLMYTAEKLKEANYLNYTVGWSFNTTRIIIVKSITYQGHQFLDTIRDDYIWKGTKDKISKFTSVSLPILQQIATSLIKSTLGLS